VNALSRRVALITGSSRGIGREIAFSFGSAGADVALNFLNREAEARQVQAEIIAMGRRCSVIQADVRSKTEVLRLVRTAESEIGGIDILVNNAGISRPQTFEEITEQDWDEVLTANLKSCFLVTQAVLPGMRARRWGRIINLSSVAAQTGGVVGPHYAASKAGILGLTHFFANYLAKDGISVNAIAPALIETEMVHANRNASPNLIPVGRFGEPNEVASVAVMLARNAYINGQTINVNGGLYMA
jgi:3-oxoacyl-[acyl-carrier protein] reductase